MRYTRASKSWLVPAWVVMLGCGEEHGGHVCPSDAPFDDLEISCLSSQIFAARDSEDILPTQEAISAYFDYWSRAITAEPILEGRFPQLYRSIGLPSSVEILTRNTLVIDAFSHGALTTGDSGFDFVITFFGDIASVTGPSLVVVSPDTSSFVVTLANQQIYNEEKLQERLLSTGSRLFAEPRVAARDDGVWTWIEDGETAQIDFRFGWGDCFVACDGFHSVRAIVPPDGGATVFDLGGDELPPFLHLAPDTRPLP